MNTELSKIIQLINQKSFQKAETLSRKELAKEPNSFTLNKALAISLLAQKKYNQSLISFNKCYELNQNDYDINVNIALIFNKVQDYQNAIFFSEQALQLDPSRPEVYHNLAHSYLYIPDLEKAEKYILKSIELRGGIQSKNILRFKDTLNIYTDVLLAKGDKIAFKKICLEILDTEVYFGDIFRKLLRHERKNISDKHIRTLENILIDIDKYGDTLDNKLTKAGVYSCLAEYFEKINKEKSEGFYEKSNLLITSVQRESIFDRQSKVNEIRNFFKDIDVIQYTKDISPNLGDGLIFIIGMPRSGTTLVESILASAENSIAGGEKVFFHMQCTPLIKQYQTTKIITENVFSELGKNYLRIIGIQKKEKKIFIDKMPDNYLYYEFIKTSLPKSKFIHVHRDPWDNAISLFKQNFASELFYASSFFGIAVEYANYEYLMKNWKERKNNDIFDVQYEDLVNHPDKIITDLWEFCDLKGQYNEDTRRKHFAQTASKQQVTREIYSTSSQKKDFIKFKESFLKDLGNQREFWLNRENS